MGLRLTKIDSEQVFIGQDWTITDQVNARKTMSARVVALLALAKIDNGDVIEMTDGAEILYAGTVGDISTSEPYKNGLEYAITTLDNSALADRRRIAAVFEDTLAGDIVKASISQVLTEENVTEGTIQDGPIIKKAVFNYIKCSEALEYLREITGFIWEIDNDRKLNFYDRATNRGSDLTDSTQHSKFKLTSKMAGYRNRQYLRGGKTETALQENEALTPKPDGASRTFVARFPIAKKPTIEVNLNGAGWTAIAPADIGVNGLDEGRKWYWGYNSATITQADTETVLADVDAVRATYTGLRNLFVVLDNPAEIANRKAAEPLASGIYEELVLEQSIDTAAQAAQYSEGLIETYGEIKDYVTFDTEKAGYRAGQIIRVTKSLYGIDDDFLIEGVTARPMSNTQILYSVKALDGAAVGGWETFFKKLVKNQKDFTIAADEVIIILQTQTESRSLQGQYEIRTVGALYPDTHLFPAAALYPGTLAKEETIND